MAQACLAEGMTETAVFDLIFRKVPERRDYLLAGGIPDALDFLSEFGFTADDLNWLRTQPGYSESFLDSLGDLRFTGDVYAVPEGTPMFPNEPLIEVEKLRHETPAR